MLTVLYCRTSVFCALFVCRTQKNCALNVLQLVRFGGQNREGGGGGAFEGEEWNVFSK